VYKLQGRKDGGVTDLPFERAILGRYINHPVRGIVPVENDGFHRVMDETGAIHDAPTLLDTAIITYWELDSDEQAAIMQTHEVRLTIHGEPIPPVSLGVVSPADREIGSEDFEPPIARAHLRRAIDLLHDKLLDMGHDPASPEDIEKGLDQCLLETAAGYEG
jgi:hypothetical protein